MAEHVKRPGIPTIYNGRRYRSRLEAMYAAFFDRIEWPAFYEPVDLPGYCPDWIVDFQAGKLLIEVKGLDEELELAQMKIDRADWAGEAIVCPGKLSNGIIGAFRESDGPGWFWGTAELFFCISCGSVSVRCGEGSWRCRVCGIGGGNAHVGSYDPSEDWTWAANRVQWRPGT
jgi:hypothetical protein